MLRVLLVILLLAIAAVGFAWYSMQSLPSWFDETADQEQPLVSRVEDRGVSKLLGDKVADVLNGEVVFSEAEFNAIFIASLQRSEDGQRLLEVSDAVKAFLHEDQVELTAIINLDKVERINPKARKRVEQFDKIFPFLEDSRVALTVYGTPVVRAGDIGIKDDFHIKVGAIPISNESLRGLGVDVERANTTNLPLKYLLVKSVLLADESVAFKVRPRF